MNKLDYDYFAYLLKRLEDHVVETAKNKYPGYEDYEIEGSSGSHAPEEWDLVAYKDTKKQYIRIFVQDLWESDIIK